MPKTEPNSPKTKPFTHTLRPLRSTPPAPHLSARPPARSPSCRRRMGMGFSSSLFFFFLFLFLFSTRSMSSASRSVVDVDGGPDGVVWVVQLSDLHFSVFHPDRAGDFRHLMGPMLAMVNPSLVLITGDLTDGKSKDLLTMKQNEKEWLEYFEVVEDVVRISGLDKKVFYDLRGNHDNFGVPAIGGSFDFYHNYSINGQLRRTGNVQSVTLQNHEWKHLFVGLDSTMDIGLRGPTNLFGHPTDKLLSDIGTELSQWDSHSRNYVTKIAFGHFPLSFSAETESGKNLKDIFLKHSLSAYLCGHLHSKFGKNLKRHHLSGRQFHKYLQMNMHQGDVKYFDDRKDCSKEHSHVDEFWEWEMGDWRKSRMMRLLAIDAGHISFVDLSLTAGTVDTVILPTFPIDSRVMQRLSSHLNYQCQSVDISSYDSIRALVFSRHEMSLVVAKIYDSRSGKLVLVFEGTMQKYNRSKLRGDLYSAPWIGKAFVDQSPARFWLQVEAIDISGRLTFSSMRPFSINGLTEKVNWKWKEFFVMGCQWSSLYRPLLLAVFILLFSFLLIPKAFILFKYNFPKNFILEFNVKSLWKWLPKLIFWSSMELARITTLWTSALVYLLNLLYFPWFSGHIFTEGDKIGHMSYNGWMVNSGAAVLGNAIGFPDVMVIVLPHLVYVVMPMILISAAFAAEKAANHMHYLVVTGKKQDDIKYGCDENLKQHLSVLLASPKSLCSLLCFCKGRWVRKFLLVSCFAVLFKHWKSCRALIRAYEMNPFLHSPVYCFTAPIFLFYAFYKTKG